MATLDEKQREAAIRYIVNQIHTPRMSIEIAQFLAEFAKHVQFSTSLSKEIGIAAMPEPPVLDYSRVTEALIQDLLMFEEVYNKSKKPK